MIIFIIGLISYLMLVFVAPKNEDPLHQVAIFTKWALPLTTPLFLLVKSWIYDCPWVGMLLLTPLIGSLAINMAEIGRRYLGVNNRIVPIGLVLLSVAAFDYQHRIVIEGTEWKSNVRFRFEEHQWASGYRSFDVSTNRFGTAYVGFIRSYASIGKWGLVHPPFSGLEISHPHRTSIWPIRISVKPEACEYWKDAYLKGHLSRT